MLFQNVIQNIGKLVREEICEMNPMSMSGSWSCPFKLPILLTCGCFCPSFWHFGLNVKTYLLAQQYLFGFSQEVNSLAIAFLIISFSFGDFLAELKIVTNSPRRRNNLMSARFCHFCHAIHNDSDENNFCLLYVIKALKKYLTTRCFLYCFPLCLRKLSWQHKKVKNKQLARTEMMKTPDEKGRHLKPSTYSVTR